MLKRFVDKSPVHSLLRGWNLTSRRQTSMHACMHALIEAQIERTVAQTKSILWLIQAWGIITIAALLRPRYC
jgi:hypothetical protein